MEFNYKKAPFTAKLTSTTGAPVYVDPDRICFFHPETYETEHGDREGTMLHMDNAAQFVVVHSCEAIAELKGKVAILPV